MRPGINLRIAALVGLLLWLLPMATSAQDSSGQAVYEKYCSQCHGDKGDGHGIATIYLKPAPRDFTSGKYKIRRTPTGSLPLDEDLKRVVEVGLPYTAMPGFSGSLTDSQIDSVVEYIKSFSPDFEDPELTPEPFEIPSPPPYTEASVARGAELYVQTGCGACHGEIGYGDGLSAPTLRDDWGVHIKPADLSKPWTFRGGGRREDIFRTMSAGFNGTPMPGFHGALPPEDIWGIVDYMLSLAGGPSDEAAEAPYANLLRSVATEAELDLSLGQELFAQAPEALFPLVGQIVEPGRSFYPAVDAVSVRAIHNEEEIAFLVTWHDMRAETVGANSPDLRAPRWLDHLEEIGWATVPGGKLSESESESEEGLWGDAEAEGGDVWGDAAADDGGDVWGDAEADEGDVWGDAEADEGDVWGDDAASDEGGDFWGEDEGEAASAGRSLPMGPDTEFSDAIALQFPQSSSTGVRKPYFIFGDAQNPVELWFRDLASSEVSSFIGRGSSALAPAESGDVPESVVAYEKGEWSVIFKRKRKSRASVSFEENTFVPVAFSIWDGFNRERGNRRGLSSWYNVYISPLEKPDPVGPMVKAGLGVLGLEVLIIALMRRRFGKKNGTTAT